MKDSRELVPTPERREIERPIELPQTGNYPMYRGMNEANSSIFFEYWNAIRKRLWLVLGVAVIATTLTAIYMARRPNVYQAKSQVQVDLEQANPDLRMSDRPVIGNSDPAYFNTQLQLLTSDKLLRRVVKELGLDTNKEFVTAKAESSVSPWQSVLRTLGLASKPKEDNGGIEEVSQTASSNLATTEEINEAIRLAPFVDVIRKNFAIDPVRENRGTVKDTRLIDISFKHTNAELAAQVVNGIAEVFIKQNAEKRNKNSDKTSGFLEERIANLQTDIKNDENKLAEEQRAAGIIKTDENQTIVTKGLEAIQKNLLDAENARKNAEAEYNAATRSPESLKAKASEKAERYITEQENNIRSFVAKNNDSITGLQTQREKLLVEYVESAPEVREVDRQIAILVKAKNDYLQKIQNDLENYKNKAVNDELQNLKTKMLQAQEAEQKLRSSFDSQSKEAQGQNQAAISIRLLQQRLDQNKQFLENLIKQQRENDVVSVGTDNNISIADFAIPPDQAVSPRRLTTVLIALILSTFFGAGLALFLEYLDDSIRSAEEIENLLQVPALAAIPTIESSPKRRLLLVGGDDFEEKQKSELLLYADSRSSLAEAYRQLRTSILLSTAGHAPKSLLITSSMPSEGKTTTAVNTAISLAQTGANVLIIDADMRRPRLHSIFNISNAEGLSTTLSSELSEPELLNIVQQDENSKLYLLPSGPVPPNPAELIGSEQMTNLLQELSKHFTHIVVDSPPIASFTDGVLIASMVDGVILVVNSGKSSRQIIKRSRQLLQDIGAKVFGVVLNNVNFRSQDNYYYQSYYHRDYYRHEDE